MRLTPMIYTGCLTSTRVPNAAGGGDGPSLGRLTDVIAGQPMEALVGENVRILSSEKLAVGRKLPERQRDCFVTPLLRNRLVARQSVTMNMEHVGVEGKFVDQRASAGRDRQLGSVGLRR